VRVRVVVGFAVLVVAVATVIALSQRGARLAGTNGIKQQAFVVALPAGRQACQRFVLLVDDAARTQVLVGTNGKPAPPLAVTFADRDGRFVARGLGRPTHEGLVTIPIGAAVDGTRPSTTACIRNLGDRPIVLGGDIAKPEGSARIDGRTTGGAVSFRYLRAGNETWWSLLPTIASRFGIGKAPIFGDWTLPAAALLLLAVWIAAIRLLVREDR
jgi:hypothetical protein